ncbi:MAG: helix-turn-helix transcriptional regulator [Lewinellaceae bacterium]|nr:helix-turn-helix transcriptional regulator [Lewinella sp.]MCB9279355.1 helix-turn-helix transcriptional regulator [Lewinellaceae bacterium]
MPKAWTLFFLLAAGQGFFQGLAFLVFPKRQPRATVALAMLMFTFSVMIVQYVLFWTGLQTQFPKLMWFEVLAVYLVPAWLMLYRAWLSPKPSPWIYLVFLPAFAYLLFWLPLFLKPMQEVSEMLRTGTFRYFHPIRPFQYIGYLNGAYPQIAVTLLSAAGIVAWQKADKNLHPDARNWWTKVTWLYLGYAVAFCLYWILVFAHLLRIQYDYMISAAMCVFIYTVGLMAYRQSFQLQPAEQERQYAREFLLTPAAAAALQTALLKHMEKDRPWLDAQLRLNQLAEAIHATPHQLSELLNEHMDTNYAAFVNGYRIREAVSMLDNPGHSRLAIKEIAYQTGFNNLTSFNKTFKAAIGSTPSEFRNKAFA